MLDNIKKGFELMVGAILASAVVQCVGELAGVKPKENDENPEKKEEA